MVVAAVAIRNEELLSFLMSHGFAVVGQGTKFFYCNYFHCSDPTCCSPCRNCFLGRTAQPVPVIFVRRPEGTSRRTQNRLISGFRPHL